MRIKNLLSFGLSDKAEQKKAEFEELLSQRAALQRKAADIEEVQRELAATLEKVYILFSDELSMDRTVVQNNRIKKTLQKKYLSFLNASVTSSISKSKVAELSAGLTTGIIGGAGAFGLVGTLGTASTGTAIATLSGAAATNATLASLGLGSVASGGMGILGGVCMLGGICAVAAVPGILSANAYKNLRGYEKGIKTLTLELKKLPSILEMMEIHKKLIATKEVLSFLIKQYEDHEMDKKTLLKNIHKYL